MRGRVQDLAGQPARARAFTLVELLIVVVIIVLVSAVALPTVLPALARRQVSEAARLLQGALVGARDRAIHDGRPSGIRLLPDPAWPLQYDATTGRLVPGRTLAYSRVIPIDPAPEYREGMVTVRPSAAYAADVVDVPGLVLEEAPIDRNGAPNPPVSWMWNIRVGDRLQLNDAGPWYTVVGPMQVGPAAGNSEMFVNVGPSGATSPLNPSGSRPIDYLILTNGIDDNRNGWVDEGWDGVDNDGNKLTDEHIRAAQGLVSEWEAERWIGGAAAGMASQPYAIRRRPMPSPDAREVALPTQMVIDAARSRLPVNPHTGAVEVMVNPDGTAAPSLPYGVPSSLSMGSAFLHFALVGRADVHPPDAGPMPAPRGGWSILTLDARSGDIVATDEPDPADPFAHAQQGGK
jgi:prepilin-type N-terminal cleavage/methylation domain-containing protein